jgi:high-affinity iron transporter
VARRSLLSLTGIALVIAVTGITLAAISPWSGESSPKPVTVDRSTANVAPFGSNAPTQQKVFDTTRSKAELADDSADEILGPDGSVVSRQSELVPLPVSAFRRPVADYRAYATRQARAMTVPVGRMIVALRAGDRPAAEIQWNRAYTRYLLLGAAYGALGDLDQAIDGEPGGLPRGVHDPHFSGLHRVERELWTGAPTREVLPWASRLQRYVAQLPRAIARLQITPLDYATRAHEILEDAQRDQLSGVAAPWSGAGLTATAAGLAATDRVMATLRATLAGRESVQQTVTSELTALHRTLATIRADHHGRYPRLDALTSHERAQLDGATGAALEALSEVPGALETQRPPSIEPIP